MQLRRRRNTCPTRVSLHLVALIASALTVVTCSAIDTPTVRTSSTMATDSSPGPRLSSCPTADTAPDRVRCADVASLTPIAVLRVVDGDTFHARINGADETVRFFGIDTPERGEPCFTEATRRAKDLLDGRVKLVADARNRDRYGRLLRYVYSTDGHSIDALLIAEGFAHAWREDGALHVDLIALEDRARAANVGCLWSK